MAVINIDDAYILGETGAQVDKVTGLFTKDEGTTSGEKAFAQLNIGTAGSNRNLLDNPWFTVRQRGNGPFTGTNVTGIDRWKTTNSNSTVTGNDGYITLTAASGGNGFIRQILPEALYGTYTYSAYIRGSGAGYVSVNNSDLSVISSKTFSNLGNDWVLVTGTFTTSGNGAEVFSIRANAGTSIDIKCVKLELGSVSTLANDAPPDYGEELAKCGRYFFRAKGEPIAVGYVSSNFQYVYVSVPALAPMRATPTISYSGGFTARLQEASIAITSMYASTPLTTGNAIGVQMVLASSARATGPAAIYCSANDYIDFSADL